MRVDGYQTYRKDRGGNGGGVLVHVSETLKKLWTVKRMMWKPFGLS